MQQFLSNPPIATKPSGLDSSNAAAINPAVVDMSGLFPWDRGAKLPARPGSELVTIKEKGGYTWEQLFRLDFTSDRYKNFSFARKVVENLKSALEYPAVALFNDARVQTRNAILGVKDQSGEIVSGRMNLLVYSTFSILVPTVIASVLTASAPIALSTAGAVALYGLASGARAYFRGQQLGKKEGQEQLER